MRTIIAGSRTITRFALIDEAVRASGFAITVVLSGGARGVDRLGERWAAQRQIPVERFLADWDRYDLAAGEIRNREMVAARAEALVALWDGVSRGTNNCIDEARQRGLKVFVFRVSDAY